MADDTEGQAEAVGEAVGDVTATVVADAIEGAEARAAAAEAVAEAVTDAALASATGQQIEQVERDTWREIGLLRERGDALEARLAQTEQRLSSLTETQLFTSEQTSGLLAMLATQSTPPPPPTPPEPEPTPPSVSPAAVGESPADDPAPAKPVRRHRFL